MRYLLAGYYGFRNWGDEGSLATLLQVLEPSRCLVLSGNLAFTERVYGVRAVPRMNLHAVRHAIRTTDALILGGGSLLQDATSLRSLLYYLMLIQTGLKYRKRVLPVAQGVGPLHRRFSRWLTARVLNRVPFISLRDEESATLLRSIGVRQELRIDADLTWALQPAQPPWMPPTERPCVGLAPRAWKDAPIESAFSALARTLLEQGFTPVLIPMQESQDRALCEAIARATNALLLPEPSHPAQLLGVMQNLQAMVAVRLHGAIFALSQGVPTLCVVYDPKVRALAEQVAMPTVELDEALTQQLPSAWERIRTHLPTLSDSLRRHTEPLGEKARELLKFLCQFGC